MSDGVELRGETATTGAAVTAARQPAPDRPDVVGGRLDRAALVRWQLGRPLLVRGAGNG